MGFEEHAYEVDALLTDHVERGIDLVKVEGLLEFRREFRSIRTGSFAEFFVREQYGSAQASVGGNLVILVGWQPPMKMKRLAIAILMGRMQWTPPPRLLNQAHLTRMNLDSILAATSRVLGRSVVGNLRASTYLRTTHPF